MTKTYITVCKNTVLHNIKHSDNKPPIRVSYGKYGKPTYHHEYHVPKDAKIVYSPDKPLPWGARVWIEV